MPRIPSIQVPQIKIIKVWKCSKCGKEVARGEGSHPPANCPYCGTRLLNGFGPSTTTPNAPRGGAQPLNPPPGTMPQPPVNAAPDPRNSDASGIFPVPDPVPLLVNSTNPTSTPVAASVDYRGLARKTLLVAGLVIALGMLVTGAIILIKILSSPSPRPRRAGRSRPPLRRARVSYSDLDD
jgi:DNA-directed RNA polymerase subunit RPC12/RpoP